MESKAVFHTFLSRFGILVLGFAVLAYTTQVWGSQGRGAISLLIADLAIVSFFSNIIVGSSISYYTPRVALFKLVPLAYFWCLFIGISVPFVITSIHEQEHRVFLIIISCVFSLCTVHTNIFVGLQHMKAYNIYTFLQYAVLMLFLILFVFVKDTADYTVYFVAQIFTFSSIFLVSLLHLYKQAHSPLFSWNFDKRVFFQLFSFGIKTELSGFMQFINNRLSYYALASLWGIPEVGKFAVGVACAEAILVLSKSFSIHIFSQTIGNSNEKIKLMQTQKAVRISLFLTLCCVCVISVVPNQTYTWVFGNDFFETKYIILLLSPGIIALSASGIIGHYFSGSNQLNILNVKSAIGLCITILLCFFLIPKYGVYGACIAVSLSYIVSSIVLFYWFYKHNSFSWRDFMFRKSDMIENLQIWKKK